jgi:hypothetical protein
VIVLTAAANWTAFACLIVCGIIGANLALRSLSSDEPPQLGRGYRLYAFLSNSYARARDGRASAAEVPPCSES